MTTRTIRIGGMTCVNCQNRIEKKLKSAVGVEKAAVDYTAGLAVVTWNPSVITFSEIKSAIESLGYEASGGTGKVPVLEIIGTLAIILFLYALARTLSAGAFASAFPLVEAGMGYGMVFVVGLVTSAHCIAMCGGINLSQCMPSSARREGPGWKTLFPALLYNAGRVVSYTIVGVIVGTVGSVVLAPGRFQGAVQLIAGVFMVVMGLNMLGIFQGSFGTLLRRVNPRAPKIFAKKPDGQKAANKNPLVIGLLNGLMPCGPLQAMQLYALSTGSPAAGGVSMLLFSMGTVPLMFGVGALSSLLSKKFTRRAMKAGAILVTVMGMTMFSYGWGLSGFSLGVADTTIAAAGPSLRFGARPGGSGDETFTPVIEGGAQIVNSTLRPGRYPAITVQRGIPVKWIIAAPRGSINGCNNRMIIREYKIEHRFVPGENVLEFMPERTGKFSYSCWMGMIRSSITVVEDGQSAAAEPNLDPAPAGVAIPVDTLALAEIQSAEAYGFPYQTVAVNLRDDGMDPALIVLQRNMPALLNFNRDSPVPGNSRLVFPAYYTRIELEQGDTIMRLLPVDDFDFSTGDNVFYGYVKVVDDLNQADIEAIKKEVSGFETQIYPDAYFEETALRDGCCG